jgi:ribosomal protein S12
VKIGNSEELNTYRIKKEHILDHHREVILIGIKVERLTFNLSKTSSIPDFSFSTSKTSRNESLPIRPEL